MAFQEFSKNYLFFGTIISTYFVLKSSGIFPVIFIFIYIYSYFHLCNIAINFQIFLNNYHYILLNYTLTLRYRYFSIIYFSIIYFTFTISNWCTVSKDSSFISFICLSDFISCYNNCYSSFKKYVCITIIT